MSATPQNRVSANKLSQVILAGEARFDPVILPTCVTWENDLVEFVCQVSNSSLDII